MIHNAIIRKVGVCAPMPEPQYGDCKLSVFPFENGKRIVLPDCFKIWERFVNALADLIPLQRGANTHYLTIDSRFFTRDGFLRREGLHADGNFCVDPNFNHATWGGTETETWGGMSSTKYEAKPDNSHVKMNWVLPYKIVIPVGDYISDDKGGILCVASQTGCQGWEGEFYGEVGAEGDFTAMQEQLTDDKKVIFEKDNLYFMTSNTPHETLVVEKGKRRTLLRITLNHEYMNQRFLEHHNLFSGSNLCGICVS